MPKIKNLLGVGVLTGIAVLTVPYLTKNSIDSILSQQQKELNSQGIKLDIVSHKGYFESTRKVKIGFGDTVKVLDTLSKTTQIDLETLNSFTNNGMLLSELSFQGIVKNSNFFPSVVKAEISLDTLPQKLQKLMAEDKKIKEFIESLLLDVHFDAQGKVAYVALNDLILQDESVVAKVMKPQVKIKENRYDTSIQNITFSLNKSHDYLLIYLDDIKDSITYKDEFNFTDSATVEKIKFHFKEKMRHFTQEFKHESSENIFDATMNTKNNKANLDVGYKISDTLISINSADTKIDKFMIDLKVKDLKEQPLRVLNKNLANELELSKIAEPKIQEIINDGFSLHLKSNIKNIVNNNFSAKDVDIDLDFDLSKNDINKYQSIDYAIKYLNVNGKIRLDNKSAKDISKALNIEKYNNNKQSGTSTFDIIFKDSRLFINGQKI